MSPTASVDYGTDDPRAFAYFIAGFFAERTGKLETAADLYTAAIRLDSDYHKALNNRGFLMQNEGAALYVKATDDARGRQLLEDAAGLCARAKVLRSIAEYHYNYGTILSYLGRLDLRQGDRASALERQVQSITAYTEGLRAIDREIAGLAPPRASWWPWRWRAPDPADAAWLVERQGFKRSIQVALAISCVLRRKLEGVTSPLAEEQTALDEVFAAFAARSRTPSHPKLEYNLACYYAVTGKWEEAVSLFLTLRAIIPDLAQIVLADPDVADLPQITELFAGTPSPAPQASAANPALPAEADDPDRDEPT